MQAQWDEGGWRILLAHNTVGGGGSCIRSGPRAGVWISYGFSCEKIHGCPYVQRIPTCAKFDLCRTFRNVTAYGSVCICIHFQLALGQCVLLGRSDKAWMGWNRTWYISFWPMTFIFIGPKYKYHAGKFRNSVTLLFTRIYQCFCYILERKMVLNAEKNQNAVRIHNTT